jgi:hypothetical protein
VIVTCAALPGGHSIAFDSRCDIDVASLPADARLADARLIRKRGPDRAPPLALPIRLPPP